jgi:hypothetical protein
VTITRTPRRSDPILGIERWCFACGEFWPEDGEFWYFDKRGQVMGRCKACWADRKRKRGR